jgi:hypothetical protein
MYADERGLELKPVNKLTESLFRSAYVRVNLWLIPTSLEELLQVVHFVKHGRRHLRASGGRFS